LYLTAGSIDSKYTNFFIKQGNNYFKSNINQKYELNRFVEINKKSGTETQIHLKTVFQDKTNPDGSLIAKDIYTDLRREALIPTIFLLALIIATPLGLKRKVISLLIGFILIHFYIYFKLYTFAFDNYSYPEFQLIELSPIISSVVYASNFFFEMTGSSTIVIVPIVIWVISCWNKETLKLLSISK
jgi:hypothetical protein